jgi:hypothetical protein
MAVSRIIMTVIEQDSETGEEIASYIMSTHITDDNEDTYRDGWAVNPLGNITWPGHVCPEKVKLIIDRGLSRMSHYSHPIESGIICQALLSVIV